MDVTMLSPDKRSELVERITNGAHDTPGGCRRWNGSHSKDGYARTSVRVNGKKYVREAHRLLWLLVRGPIDQGSTVDHLCRVRDCVNLDHMELVIQKVNTFRGIGITAENKRKTHCVRGHEFTEDNIYRAPSMPNSRQCRKCIKIHAKNRGY